MNLWLQRAIALLVIVAVSVLLFFLANTDNGDATIIAIISLLFNIVVYFIGRSDRSATHQSTPD